MDNFRWILLAVGILIIVIIYLISRKNRRDFYQEDDYQSEDLPDIKTTSWDDLDEGVGEVRIIARSGDDSPGIDDDSSKSYFDKKYIEDESIEEDDALMAAYRPGYKPAPAAAYEPEPESEFEPALEPEPESASEPDSDGKAEAELPVTVIVLNILARDGSTLSGKSINSVAHANDMVFGDMNIYHRMDANSEPVFSMVNMIKPGSFDPATIHELKTPGISLFLQLPGPFDASAAYDDMLQTAHRMSEILEARLCDKTRQPLTESVAEEYRSIAASFDGKI